MKRTFKRLLALLVCLAITLGIAFNQTYTSQEPLVTTVTAAKKKYVSVKVIGRGKTMMSGKVVYTKSMTAYTALKKLAAKKKKKIVTSGFGKMIYVRSIGGLKEKQYGSASGWMYKVNGKVPNVGSNSYKIKANAKVVWYYVNYK